MKHPFLVLQLEGFCVEGLSLLAREFKGHSKPELTSQGKSQKNKYEGLTHLLICYFLPEFPFGKPNCKSEDMEVY